MAEPTQAAPGDASDGSTILHLLVSGPDVHESIALPEQGTLSIGRGDDADVRILDPRSSREHARLHIGEGVWIEDLGGRNGTRVGAERIAPNQPVPLSVGLTVFIGDTALVLQERWERSREPRVRSHGYFFDRVIAECARSEGNAEASFAVLRIHVPVAADAARAVPIIATQLRLGDLLAAYAPHEHEVLLPDSTADKCHEIANRIGHALREARIASHLGVALYPRDGTSAGAIISQACTQALGRPAIAADAVVCDPGMEALYRQAKQAARAQATILILGESGVGKEVLAAFVQKQSRRAGKPFVTLNCAALPETLLESHLFGHERGAFTDAARTSKGLIETADGGTLFLDEVGEMSFPMQAKLLRAIDKGEIMRVGATAVTKVDVRYIAATNRNLREEVEARRFREDLYHRLAVVELRVPPLCQRKGEIEPLVRRFLAVEGARAGRKPPEISASAMSLLLGYDWPGNVRELHNAIERAVALCEGDTVTSEHLPLDKLTPVAAVPTEAAEDPQQVFASATSDTQIVRKVILDTLAKCAGNQTRAAKLLGTNRFALMRRLKDLEIPRPRANRPTPIIQ